MTVLTVTAVLALASSCQSLVAPMTIAKIAQHESGLDPLAQHQNRDGSTDYGLLQINSANFAWLGLTIRTALDPCRSIAAGAEVLTAYSRFNTGSPTRGIVNGYAASVQGVRFGLDGPVSPGPPPPPPCAPRWDAWALAACSKPRVPPLPSATGASVVALTKVPTP